jgi:ubiquinone/menaquinone biosynthesis C-methylase UbiE
VLGSLRRSYDRSADGYDERFRALQREKYRLMLEAEGPEPGGRLRPGRWLDLGCGTGLLAEWLRERGLGALPLVGVDFSRAMLRHARLRGVPALQAELGALPFRDAAFRGAFAFTALRIVGADGAEVAALSELARVVAPGGRLVATVLAASHDESFAARLRAAGFEPGPPRACGQDIGHHCHRTGPGSA